MALWFLEIKDSEKQIEEKVVFRTIVVEIMLICVSLY